MKVGGRLATSHGIRNIPGTQWFVADEPRPFIRLRAERLDRASDAIDFEAFGRPAGGLLPGEWDRGWAYGTSGAVWFDERFPFPAGCWRVTWTEGTSADAVTFVSRGPAFNAAEVGWRGAPR